MATRRVVIAAVPIITKSRSLIEHMAPPSISNQEVCLHQEVYLSFCRIARLQKVSAVVITVAIEQHHHDQSHMLPENVGIMFVSEDS